jgi:AcrR family transcriptional regulator
LFDRFAGIFHAFECLRDHVCLALEAGTNREADYRLFGTKFDSLGCLLERLLEDIARGNGDPVEHYVTALSAKQLLRDVVRDFPDYCASHRDDVKALQSSIDRAEEVRATLVQTNPELPEFFEWFDRWFLLRAKGLASEESA